MFRYIKDFFFKRKFNRNKLSIYNLRNHIKIVIIILLFFHLKNLIALYYFSLIFEIFKIHKS